MKMMILLLLIFVLMAFGCCGIASVGDTISDSVSFDSEHAQYLKVEHNCYWDGSIVVCEGTITNLANDRSFEDLNLKLAVVKPKGVTSDCAIADDTFEIGTLQPGEIKAFSLKADASSKQNVRAIIFTGGLILDCT